MGLEGQVSGGGRWGLPGVLSAVEGNRELGTDSVNHLVKERAKYGNAGIPLTTGRDA